MNRAFDLYARSSSRLRAGWEDKNREFRCARCRHLVPTHPLLAGVQNRNHCPYCLWSRHLDLYTAGDRLSACKAPMQPVAVTQKQTRKKYGPAGRGELMLVHLCLECGKVSTNRIAADDDAETVYATFQSSLYLEESVLAHLEAGGARPMREADEPSVHAQLFGPHGQPNRQAALAELLDEVRMAAGD